VTFAVRPAIVYFSKCIWKYCDQPWFSYHWNSYTDWISLISLVSDGDLWWINSGLWLLNVIWLPLSTIKKVYFTDHYYCRWLWLTTNFLKQNSHRGNCICALYCIKSRATVRVVYAHIHYDMACHMVFSASSVWVFFVVDGADYHITRNYVLTTCFAVCHPISNCCRKWVTCMT